jgi:Ca-activated chloride channel homolog
MRASHLLLLLTACLGCIDQSAQPPARPAPNFPTRTEGSPPAAPSGRVQIPLDDKNAKADPTRNFYFIFDSSGSMGDSPRKTDRSGKVFPRRIDATKWAVQEFLGKVPDDVNLGLWIFNGSGAGEVVPLGTAKGNRAAFLKAVESTQPGDGTPLSESIIAGVDKLVVQYKRQLGYGEYRLIVLTDGEPTGIPLPRAVDYAASYGIPIYTIGVCMDQDHSLRRHSLSYRAADNAEEMASALEETLAETKTFDAADFQEAPK